jgi:hypothetical protein
MTDQENAKIYSGFFPYVSAAEVSMTQAGAGVIVTSGDVDIRQAGANAMIVGGDVSLRQGGSQLMIASGDVSVTQGGAGLAVGRTVDARSSIIGIAVGREVTITDDSKVVFEPRSAAAFGAGVAVALFLLRRIFRRR